MLRDLAENWNYWTSQSSYIWRILITKSAQVILANTTPLGSVSTITVGNSVHFKYTLIYKMWDFDLSRVIKDWVYYWGCAVWRTGWMKNRKSVQDKPVSEKTSSCSATAFSEGKMKMPQEELLTLGRTRHHKYKCVHPLDLFLFMRWTLFVLSALCRNNVCFINRVHHVSHKSSLPPREAL